MRETKTSRMVRCVGYGLRGGRASASALAGQSHTGVGAARRRRRCCMRLGVRSASGLAGGPRAIREPHRLRRTAQPTASRSRPTVAYSSPSRAGSSRCSTASRHVADDLRRPPDRGLQLLGPRAARPRDRPTVPDPSVRVRGCYTFDAAIGGTAPRWGTPGRRLTVPRSARSAPSGCVVSGRLSRLTASGNTATAEDGTDQRLVPAVPEPFDGRAEVRPDGALYLSGGEGASISNVDYGQRDPRNPCGDPPSEGGALRARICAPR